MHCATSKILTTVFTTALALGVSTSAKAGPWANNHPRRAEVNGRLENQNRRINREYREGEINKAQAQQLHQKDHQIRQEERDMASQNGGHITKQEQNTLNQQENGVSRQIGQ
jgi:TolA-binding protein